MRQQKKCKKLHHPSCDPCCQHKLCSPKSVKNLCKMILHCACFTKGGVKNPYKESQHRMGGMQETLQKCEKSVQCMQHRMCGHARSSVNNPYHALQYRIGKNRQEIIPEMIPHTLGKLATKCHGISCIVQKYERQIWHMHSSIPNMRLLTHK